MSAQRRPSGGPPPSFMVGCGGGSGGGAAVGVKSFTLHQPRAEEAEVPRPFRLTAEVGVPVFPLQPPGSHGRTWDRL